MPRITHLLATILAFSACGLDIQTAPELEETERAVAQLGEAVDDVVEGASAIVTVPLLALDRKQKLLSEVVAAQPKLARAFAPEGCATIVTEGNVVTFQFDGCSGPWGAARATGSAVASFLPGSEEGGFLIEFATEEGFVLAGQPIAYTTSFDIVQREKFSKVAWKGTYEGQTRDEQILRIETDVRMRLDDPCIEIDGDVRAQVDGRGLVLDYHKLDRCGRDACPKGDLIIRGAPDDFSPITLAFDGTPELTVTTEDGARGTLALACNARGGR